MTVLRQGIPIRPETRATRQAVMMNVLASLSLANLCHISTWTKLLARTPANEAWMNGPPARCEYLAALGNVCLLAGAVFIIFLLAGSERKRIRNVGAIGINVLALGAGAIVSKLAIELYPSFVRPVAAFGFGGAVVRPEIRPYLLMMAGGLLVAALYAVRLNSYRVAAALACFFPAVPVTFVEAAVAVWRYDPARFANRATVAPMPVRLGAPRVVWVIFDEWDQDLTFDHREAGLSLPTLDRFSEGAIVARRAFPPSSETTLSVPSLITGRLVQDSTFVDARTFLLKFWGKGERLTSWSDTETVFDRAHAAGVNTGVVGWAIAYCRSLDAPMLSCYWDQLNVPANSMGNSIGAVLVNQNRAIFETQFRSPFERTLSAVRQGETYKDLLAHAIASATDRRIGLLYVHMPVPHAPYIYDRRTGRFDRGGPPILSAFRKDFPGYIDALALVDQAVKALRESMTASGLWDSSTVLLSADHSNRCASDLTGRPRDHRVPFLLKMAGQTRGAIYPGEFNTVLTSELLMRILEGKVTTSEDAIQWLERNRSFGKSPTDRIP